jgi:hypothetical protein
LILKLGGGGVPDLRAVRSAIKEGKLSHHAHRSKVRSLCFKAYRYLRKLTNRLDRAPERFGQVEGPRGEESLR